MKSDLLNPKAEKLFPWKCFQVPIASFAATPKHPSTHASIISSSSSHFVAVEVMKCFLVFIEGLRWIVRQREKARRKANLSSYFSTHPIRVSAKVISPLGRF